MSYRRTISSLILLTLFLTGSAIVKSQGSTKANEVTSSANQHVVMSTNVGDIIIELDAERAPQTVDNFLSYVDSNFYANTLFHRVIEGFMIQGGGFTTSYQRKTTRAPISNEAYNGLQNRKYTIAMARTTAPHSATSQFFINTENNRNLNHTDTSPRGWGYTVFGRVIDGHDVVDEISRVKTGSGGQFRKDVPASPIIIEGIDKIDLSATSEPEENTAPDAPTTKVEGAAAATSIIQRTESKGAISNATNVENVAPRTDPVSQN